MGSQIILQLDQEEGDHDCVVLKWSRLHNPKISVEWRAGWHLFVHIVGGTPYCSAYSD
jgi:hypothetical protein